MREEVTALACTRCGEPIRFFTRTVPSTSRWFDYASQDWVPFTEVHLEQDGPHICPPEAHGSPVVSWYQEGTE